MSARAWLACVFVTRTIRTTPGDVRSVNSNVRLRWEYLPGRELFGVYNDQRDTRVPGFPGMVNRAIVVKMNRLVRF